MAMTAPKDILLIVHPGSACGSADFSLGREHAETQRLDMQCLIEQWQGGVLVIDGSLSEELTEGFRRGWTDLGRAIDEALARAAAKGAVSQRRRGDDSEAFNQDSAAKAFVQDLELSPDSTSFTLTGAWVDAEGGGCVNSVRETLEGLGFQARVESAMDLDFSPEEFDDEEEPADAPSPTLAAGPGTGKPGRGR